MMLENLPGEHKSQTLLFIKVGSAKTYFPAGQSIQSLQANELVSSVYFPLMHSEQLWSTVVEPFVET